MAPADTAEDEWRWPSFNMNTGSLMALSVFRLADPEAAPESEPSLRAAAAAAAAAPLEPLGRQVMVQELAMPLRRQ